MTKIKKSATTLVLAGAIALAFEGGSRLVNNVQFARAEQQVESTREQLAQVQDLAAVFRNVGKVLEPSVVQIQVTKTIKGSGKLRRGGPGGGDEFLRKFFRDHGMPDAPDGNGDQADPNDDQQAAPDDGSGDDGDLQEQGTGSGVVMEVSGSDVYILTNNHVAGGATDMVVTLSDGRVIKNGKTLGADPKSDLAVVKISADRVIAAKWGDSDKLDRGDWVLAFGSPFGFVGSMTHGIVSALNRQAGILGNNGYENFIQVDAPINPGNSGGPLVNIHGEVVGINTAIASRSGGFQGIGFAIPADQARVIYGMLKDKGKVTRGWLGVAINDVSKDEKLAKSFGYSGTTGVLVQQALRGSPAEGLLKEGDIITAVDGKPVTTTQQLRNQIALVAPGTEAKLTVFRDGKDQEVPIKIGEQPENPMAAGIRNNDGGAPGKGTEAKTADALGMKLSNITDDLAGKFQLGEIKEGALITSVKPRSIAAKGMLRPGDVIVRVNGDAVTNAKEAADLLSKVDVNKGVRLYITSQEGSRFVFLQKDQ